MNNIVEELKAEVKYFEELGFIVIANKFRHYLNIIESFLKEIEEQKEKNHE